MDKSVPTSPLLSTISADGTTSLLMNIGGVLLLFVLFIAVIVWIIRRTGLLPGAIKSGKYISILESRQLGQHERVVIIDVAGKKLVLGVTASQVTCLASLDNSFQIPEDDLLKEKNEFQTTLLKVLKKSKVESAKQ